MGYLGLRVIWAIWGLGSRISRTWGRWDLIITCPKPYSIYLSGTIVLGMEPTLGCKVYMTTFNATRDAVGSFKSTDHTYFGVECLLVISTKS